MRTALTLTAVLALAACEAREPAPVATTARPAPAPTTAPPVLSPTASPLPTPTPRTYVVPVAGYASPRALVSAVVAADRTVTDAAATQPQVALAGQALQRAYRQLAVTPGWRDQAYTALPARLRAHARDCVTAAAELRSMVTPRSSLPRWRIVPAAPERDLMRFYRQSAARHGIDWTYLAAINLVETRMGRLRGTSSAGAQGPMQFLPSTWAEVGRGDINDPEDAIDAAARYLVRRGGREDIARGVHGYNPSDRYVRAVLAYARVLQRDPAQYRGFYHWQVSYRMVSGDVLLLEGYPDGRG